MADPFPASPPHRPVSEIDYKPVSALAVAALIVSGLFVLIFIIVAVSAFVARRPAMSWEILLLAGLGLALSIAARIHIRRSEETRTGLRLASTAWWLSVVGGVLFAAYCGASMFALWKQSEAAAARWFDDLKKKQFDRAFLMTQHPLRRQGGDIERFGAELEVFRDTEIARLFQREGDEVTAEPRGMVNSQQMDNGYRVRTVYRLASPEGAFDINLTLTGSEGKNFVGRQWQVNTDGALAPRSRTTYGRLVYELQREATFFADDWLKAVQSKKTGQVLRGTYCSAAAAGSNSVLAAEEEMKALLATAGPILRQVAAADIEGRGWEQALAPLLWGRSADDLLGRSFFRMEGKDFLTEEQKKKFGELWRLALIFPGGQSTLRLQAPPKGPQLSIDDDGIRCVILVDIGLFNGPQQGTAGAKGKLVLRCDSPEFLKRMSELKAKGKEHPEADDQTRGELLKSQPTHQWCVERLETSLEPHAPQQRQTQP